MSGINEQQKRYIKLDGIPVHMSPLRAAVYSPAIHTMFLTAIYNAATMGDGNKNKIMFTLAGTFAGAALSFATTQILTTVGPEKLIGKENFRSLCIDKKPDQNTPPTSPQNMSLAKKCLAGNGALALYATVKTVVSVAVAHGLTYKGCDPRILVFTAGLISVSSVGAARTIPNFLRFQNVCRRKWNIVNIPAPQGPSP